MKSISVLLPTKDRPDRLARALDALLAQEGADFEVVIANGGAPLAPIDDPRVLVLDAHELPVGPTASLNRAALRASGDFMHFAADDDVIQPGTLAQIADVDAPWTYAGIRFVVDGELRDQHGPFPWDAARMARFNIVPAPTVFWRRDLWAELGPFDETLPYCSDYELWARFGSRHEPLVRDHVDYLYELWGGQITSNRQAEMTAEVDALHERWARVGFGNREG